ncbi:MAG: acetyl-CoA carboxylase, carboxyltransferase subunit beta [Planctomycetia bacterium]|jgi:acetyl-CoA carboxylase carboxyl transferase subunit beta
MSPDFAQPPSERPQDADRARKDTQPAEAAEPAEKPSRLRWKRKELPGGLWLKCESCSATIYRKELEERERVCPACDFHFTLPGRERVKSTLDAGSFEERWAELSGMDRLRFNDSTPYADKLKRTEAKTGQKEALICGLGAIHGRKVVLAVLDFSFLGGSMGEVVGEKIALAADLARRERVPLVIFTSSGGARMHEGMLSLLQMAKTSAALASLNEAGGYSICVLTNPTTGGVTASFASVCDITLAEPGALIGFAGPRVIASTIKQELPPGFQRAEFLLDKGQVDHIVRRGEMRAVLARLIDYGAGAFAQPGPR